MKISNYKIKLKQFREKKQAHDSLLILPTHEDILRAHISKSEFKDYIPTEQELKEIFNVWFLHLIYKRG